MKIDLDKLISNFKNTSVYHSTAFGICTFHHFYLAKLFVKQDFGIVMKTFLKLGLEWD